MYGLIGETKSIKKIENRLLVETKTDVHTNRLVKVTRFVDYAVNIIAHAKLNTSREVIFCSELRRE